MSFSMTGYGQSAKHFGGYVVQFEVKSVNHRYSEVVLRMPREWTCYEDGLRRLVQRYVKRGRIDVFINREKEEQAAPQLVLNSSVVRSYLAAAEELAADFGVDGGISSAELLSMPGVMVPADTDSGAEQAAAWEAVLVEGLEEALSGLLEMRRREGLHLAEDLTKRLARIEEIHAELVQLAPTVVEDYRVRLRTRLSELLEEPLDEQRFSMEVAVFADRSNIDEELIRLKSHLQQCGSLLNNREPAGRKLDFLVQEMNREINTIGSKANHLAIVNRVVELKAELEKIREQAANLE
ncbi:YicC family protein [Paenibacillus sp. CAA11]|uniref:YicC/YloC family endoribonuclease n=1 Tax=Paenibacillus sp. CAA11 TaxID=1532905 RepID=UPI000D37924A|nr:YicC/YloC family endoribonuclease [Paenibacillus sp. CAA11]AWB45170.1 YicC family protein [Paenibacillus sp. CAA11]